MLKGLRLNGCYRMGLIKQVQRGTIMIAGGGGAFGTLTINAVVLENAFIRVLGTMSDASPGALIETTVQVRASLSSTTQARVDLGSAEATFYTEASIEVVEFYPGVIRVQRGTVTNTGPATTGSTTVTAVVMGKTILNHCGATSATAGFFYLDLGPHAYKSHLKLASATSVTMTMDATNPKLSTHGFELIEILLQGLDT